MQMIKKIMILAVLGATLASCNKKTDSDVKSDAKTEASNAEASKATAVATAINWADMPDLKDIGNFPFFTAPQGLKIEQEENGASDIFPFEKLENYLGTNVYTTEGKLGILFFEGDGLDFNQRLFDRNIYDYLDNMGAKQLFKGNYPANEPRNEAARTKLKENQWNGKHRFQGFVDDSPFAVYAFRNGGKNYVVNVQSNSAQGSVFIMELKDFERTMKKYSAEQMKSDIDKTGKAILNINFDTDKATLKPDGQKIADEILALLNTNPDLRLSIEGHTDNSGTPQRNKQLSIERANTVMYGLAAKGINIKRLKASGFGSEKPLKANDSDENKAQNRRVELVKF